MTYKTAFPDMANDKLLQLVPDSWVDISWHNDLCPSFEVMRVIEGEDTNFQFCRVWIDYLNTSERDFPESKRFSVSYADSDCDERSVFETDSWSALLEYVLVRQYLGKEYQRVVGYNPFLHCPEIDPQDVLSNLAWGMMNEKESE